MNIWIDVDRSATARSSLPSPLKSTADTPRTPAVAVEICREDEAARVTGRNSQCPIECSVAPAKEHSDEWLALAGNRNVQLPIAVQISYRDVRRMDGTLITCSAVKRMGLTEADGTTVATLQSWWTVSPDALDPEPEQAAALRITASKIAVLRAAASTVTTGTMAGMDGNRNHPGRLNSAPQTVLKTAWVHPPASTEHCARSKVSANSPSRSTLVRLCPSCWLSFWLSSPPRSLTASP